VSGSRSGEAMEGPANRPWAARLLLRYEHLTNSPWTPSIAVCLLIASYICGYTLTPGDPPGLASEASLQPLTGLPAAARSSGDPGAQGSQGTRGT